jgi:hypothetical protein
MPRFYCKPSPGPGRVFLVFKDAPPGCGHDPPRRPLQLLANPLPRVGFTPTGTQVTAFLFRKAIPFLP